MNQRQTQRAVFLDAMGTLVHLPRPVERLAQRLDAAGYPHSLDDVASALAAEIAFYRAHILEARDAAGLASVRARAVRVLANGLKNPPPRDVLAPMLMEALSMEVYPEVPGVLAELSGAGFTLVVVSNWDISLTEQLTALDLNVHVDAVVTSAGEGVAKPNARIFHNACTAAGVTPANVLHCGDDADTDYFGALNAGCAAVLLDRAGDHLGNGPPTTIRTLAELPACVDAWRRGATFAR